MFEMERIIRPEELEGRYRHLHHADSLKILEEGRVSFLEMLAHPMEWFFERNLFPVVTSIHVQYLREVMAGRYAVKCCNPRLEGKALFVDQELINERGKVAIRATVEWKVMDGASKRAVVPPESFLKAYRELAGVP